MALYAVPAVSMISTFLTHGPENLANPRKSRARCKIRNISAAVNATLPDSIVGLIHGNAGESMFGLLLFEFNPLS